MPRDVTCDWVNLDAGIESLVGDIPLDVERGLSEQIPKVAKKGAKELRAMAAKRWNGTTGSRYSAGFASRVSKSGAVTGAEIGNRVYPGLVHLLEKGHATLTGRRTAAYPHMAPVYEQVVVPELENAVGKVVDDALRG